jgi:hypothetical protein
LESIKLLHNEVFADIHDIELTGGIETSIRSKRTTNNTENVNADSNYWSLS